MYALHTACNSLELGDCDSALVGAVNLVFGAFGHMDAATLGALSPSSTCHTFDADADGYARAEGVGALYVKRMSDAVRDGDCIRAVIRGTAVNAYPPPRCLHDVETKIKGIGMERLVG
jgi:acyl transferase domain-containing protein